MKTFMVRASAAVMSALLVLMAPGPEVFAAVVRVSASAAAQPAVPAAPGSFGGYVGPGQTFHPDLTPSSLKTFGLPGAAPSLMTLPMSEVFSADTLPIGQAAGLAQEGVRQGPVVLEGTVPLPGEKLVQASVVPKKGALAVVAPGTAERVQTAQRSTLGLLEGLASGLASPAEDSESVLPESLEQAYDGKLGQGVEGETPVSIEEIDPPKSKLSPAKRVAKGWRAAWNVPVEMALGQKEIRPFLMSYRWPMIGARFLLIGKAVLNTAFAYSIGVLVDAAIAQTLPLALTWLGVIVGIVAARAVLQKGYTLLAGNLRVKLRRDVRVHLFKKLYAMSPGEGVEDPARLAARLTSDVGRITAKNISIPIQFPHHVIQFGLAVGFLFGTTPYLAAAVLAALPALWWLSRRYGRKSTVLQETAATRQAELTSTANDLLSRREDDPEKAAARYDKAAEGSKTAMLDIISWGTTFRSVKEFLQAFFSEVLVLGLGLGSFILYGTPTIGQVMSLRGYAKDLRGAVDGLIGLYTTGKDAEGGTRRVLDYLRSADEPTGGSVPEGAGSPFAGRGEPAGGEPAEKPAS